MAEPWNKDIERLLKTKPDGLDVQHLPAAMISFHAAFLDVPLPDRTVDPPVIPPVDPVAAAAVDAAVIEIANAMSWDVDETRQEYENFRLQATKESKNDIKDKFVGSKEHLLFGHVVGEVRRLKTVFGAMLSPTGGMVGPGPFSIHVAEGVLGYHGVAHDAGGYLCRWYKENPGYEYINEQENPNCEKNPLKGQISGIFFWIKKLKLGWLNLLAFSDPSSLVGGAPVEDISSFLEPGRLSAAGTEPSEEDGGDGVILDEAEVRFLEVMISGAVQEGDDELVNKGLESLKKRGLISGDEEAGYQITDELVLAMAITLQPELKLEAAPTALAVAPGADEQTLRYYRYGDFLVEQTTPAPGQMRLAGLRDASHAQERLLKVIPLAESDLGAFSLSLTGDKFETAASNAAAGAPDPAAGLGLDATASGVVSDVTTALDSGKVVGTIRIQQYDGENEIKSRDLQFVQGGQATWLVSRADEGSEQIDISLASTATLGLELGLTSAAEN